MHPTDMHRAIGLPASTPGIAKMLRAAGYATGAFGKWHLGYADEYNPLHHGFDEYFGELLGHADYYRHVYYDGKENALRDGLEITKQEGYLTDLINQWGGGVHSSPGGRKRNPSSATCCISRCMPHSSHQPGLIPRRRKRP